jgi:hypothetical protein
MKWAAINTMNCLQKTMVNNLLRNGQEILSDSFHTEYRWSLGICTQESEVISKAFLSKILITDKKQVDVMSACF